MIVLNIGELNIVSESASRNKELNSPTYLFSFTHKLSGQVWRAIPYVGDWTEDYLSRFDNFYICIDYDRDQSLSGNTTPTDCNIHLIEGDYWVSIYEQRSTTNLDPSKSFNKILETFGYVVPVSTTNPTYEGDNYEYKIYE